ncbi:MAG: ABC-F family ATP-binding cassette domain-containing protein [Lentisphaeria bacterium]|nr:ABC-F family ATP-binding cassette domain-containing protein [Lentisphaeria bacterium]
MIDFQNISKLYSGAYILKDVSFRINSGERVGIVGPNGAGKSTIVNIITGAVAPDGGSVVIPKDHRVGIMAQNIRNSDLDRKLVEFTSDAIPELKEFMRELHDIESRMESAEAEERTSLLRRHGELQTKIEHLGAYRLDQEAKEALTNLGFAPESFDKPLSQFSGGWQMRAALARVLISNPDILLLDEPSNYLDVPAVEWLCRFLGGFAGTLVLISHDRFLLRKLASVTLEVNNGEVTRYAGNYDYYRRERENRLKMLEAAYRNTERKKEQMERVIDRFRAKSTKAAQAKSMQKKLDRIEDVTLPDALNYSGAIRFPAPPDCGVEACRFEDVAFGYSPDKTLWSGVSFEIAAKEKVAFIGYNGMGKTTLLKLMVGKLAPTSGQVVLGHHIVVGYQAQEFGDVLAPEMSVYDAVKSALPAGASTANLMNVLGSFGFSGDDRDKPCKVLSGGEKIRLQFARIFVNPPNLLVLDEPTTHLDVAARELLQQALCSFQGTVCIVSHDIEFVRNVAQTIICIEPHRIKKYFGNYDYYLEKSRELQTDTVTPGRVSAGNQSDNSMSAKDRRRARAQARSAVSGKLREAKQLLEKLEKTLDTLADQRKVLLAKMSSGMKVDFEALNKELAVVEKNISEAETSWEECAVELEALKIENDRINSEVGR